MFLKYAVNITVIVYSVYCKLYFEGVKTLEETTTSTNQPKVRLNVF